MEALDAFAIDQLHAQDFTETDTPLWIYDQAHSPNRQSYTPTEALARTAQAPFPSECLLIWIYQQRRGWLDIRRSTFERLARDLRISAYIYTLYYNRATGYHRLTSASGTLDTFYVGTVENMVLWTRCRRSGSTRGLVLPNSRSSMTDPEAKAMRFVRSLSLSPEMLGEPMGLLWLCLTDMLHWTDAKLRVQHDIVRQVEYATGHGHVAYVMTGPPRYMVDLAVQAQAGPDNGVAASAKPNYTELSVTMGKSALDTADVKRRYEFMRRVCGDLAEAGTAGFADQAAVELIRSQVEAQFLRAEYIAERARIQMSVLWNLITREDTASSLALTKSNLQIAQDAKSLTSLALEVAQSSKNDSHAMKTIAFLTMVFLPGTFFAAFFSMPLFSEEWVRGRRLWVYWVATIVTTGVVLGVWVGFEVRMRRRGERWGWKEREREKSA